MAVGVAAAVRGRHLGVHDPAPEPEPTAVRGRRGHAQRASKRHTAPGARDLPSRRDGAGVPWTSCASTRGPGRQVSWLPDRRSPRPSHPGGPWPSVGFAPRSQLRDSPGLAPAFPALRRHHSRAAAGRSAYSAAHGARRVDRPAQHRAREGQVVGRVRGHGPRVGAGLARRGRAVHQGRQVEDGRAQAGRSPRHRVAHPRRRLHLGVHRPGRDRRQGPPRVGGRRGEAGVGRLRPADPRRAHLRGEVRLGAGRRRGRRRPRPRRGTNVVITGRDAPTSSSSSPTPSPRCARSSTRTTAGSRPRRASSTDGCARAPPRRRRHPLRRGQDDGRHRADGGAAPARRSGRLGQGRSRLHRPRLPRARHRAAGPQPRRLDVRRGRDRARWRRRRRAAPTCWSSRG